MHGLYDGEFAGFAIPTPEELDKALREAVVAIDANVLLDLYRFRPQTSKDLIKVLHSLNDRLVVPNQAVREFWRHRQRSQGSPRGATKTATDALSKSGRSIADALTNWAKAVGVDQDELAELLSRVDDFVTAVSSELLAVLEDADGELSGDPILDELAQVLEGRVTPPLAAEEWDACVAEGRRRIEAEEPPGYRDADKEEGDAPEGGAGDYLVWYQATRHAKNQDRDLLIVTRDEKEDWWWRQQSEFIGPRPELALEYRELSGHRLFLMRPADLLAKASVLEVEVDLASSADAGRIAEAEEDRPTTPWTIEALSALLERLDAEAPVQAAALRLATVRSDGRVGREKVYELGGYSDDRMLRGFTRPFRRLTESLQAESLAPAGVASIFVARYPDGVKASYFSVPSEVPELLAEIMGLAGDASGASLPSTDEHPAP